MRNFSTGALAEQPEQVLPPHTSIVDAYEQAQQDLLILGEPGAGKSALLLELAHHLVEQAEQEREQPLPVLLPLSSWATTNRPLLQNWLIEQFALLYDIPQKLSRQWIGAELVLPLLDGLDEMEEATRPACIAAINAYHREGLHSLVVCSSRTNEYDVAAKHERLALHTAVVVQPLSREQVDAYLAMLGKPLSALRTALKKNSTLATLTTTPLMLQILILTYHGTPVRQLSHQEVVLQQQIWKAYVQHVVERKGDAKHYPLDRTVIWLSWLARQMRDRNQTIFALEYLQPDCLPKKYSILYLWSIRLIVGQTFGLLVGLIVGPGRKIKPIEMIIVSWKRLKEALVTGLVAGLVVRLLIGPIVGQTFGLLVGQAGGLLIGLFTGLIGLVTGLEEKQLAERQALSPNEGIRRSLKNGLLIFLLAGLIFGLIPVLVTKLSFWLFGVLPAGLGLGLTTGLFFGLLAVIQHYVLRFWLWRTHLFPYKAVSFLDDATARVLLRRVGGWYSFIHRLVLDYFADLETTTTTTSLGDHPVQQPPLP